MVIRSTIKSISYHLILSTLLFGMGLMLSGNALEAKPTEDKDYATKAELAAEESARIAADNAEASARTSADSTHDTAISTNTGNIAGLQSGDGQ